jgi:dipeptidyl-peptidase-3
LHDCLGHGSGVLCEGTSPDSLKDYASTIEEARADLYGLYFLGDEKLIDLGLMPNNEAFKAGYYSFIMNGMLTQMSRIKQGCDIQEAHMRDRALIANWCYDHSDNTIEKVYINGKTFIRINDYRRLRILFTELLAIIQRVKSEGDYHTARELVEHYAVKLDKKLHREICQRYSCLHLAPFKGFINPRMLEVKDETGEITDIKINYTETYEQQMLRYSNEYGTL